MTNSKKDAVRTLFGQSPQMGPSRPAIPDRWCENYLELVHQQKDWDPDTVFGEACSFLPLCDFWFWALRVKVPPCDLDSAAL